MPHKLCCLWRAHGLDVLACQKLDCIQTQRSWVPPTGNPFLLILPSSFPACRHLACTCSPHYANVNLSHATHKKRLELQSSSRLSVTVIPAGFTATADVILSPQLPTSRCRSPGLYWLTGAPCPPIGSRQPRPALQWGK